MATRKRKGAQNTVELPADPVENEIELPGGNGVQEDDDPEEDAIAELRGLGGDGDFKYTVSKVSGTKPGEKTGYCATYSVGDLSLDSIRERFGGGKYRVRVTDAGGKYVTMRTFDIVDEPKAPGLGAMTMPSPAPSLDLNGLAALLAAVKPGDTSSQVMTMMLAMMKQQSEASDRMMQVLMAQQNKGPTLAELLALMKAGQKDTNSEVELLLKGLELGKSLGGGETGMLDIAKEGLAAIGPLIAAQASKPQPVARPAAPPARALAPPPAAPTATVPAQPTEPAAASGEGQDVNLFQKLQWVRTQVQFLLGQASRGKDAELYAEVFLDNLPPGITPEEILERFNATDAVAQLAQLDARVNQFAPWFEEFRTAVVEFLTSPPEDEDEDDGTDDSSLMGEDTGEDMT